MYIALLLLMIDFWLIYRLLIILKMMKYGIEEAYRSQKLHYLGFRKTSIPYDVVVEYYTTISLKVWIPLDKILSFEELAETCDKIDDIQQYFVFLYLKKSGKNFKRLNYFKFKKFIKDKKINLHY